MNEEQGTVRIRVLVDTSGKVIDAKVKIEWQQNFR